MEVKLIPIDNIRPSPFQPRETFDKEKLEELAESIKGSDLVEPILVRKKGNTYEIIAGERRWRAFHFAGLQEILAIIRDVDDIEARELSLIENWHRLALDPIEAEGFIYRLWNDGKESKRYVSIQDMSRKTGIPQRTLYGIILSIKEKEELEMTASGHITYSDMKVSRALKNEPELRKQLLMLREKGKITQEQLKERAGVIEKVSEPIKRALLREDSKLTSEEALIIDTELSTPEEKIRAIKEIETERSSNRVKRLIHIMRRIEEDREAIEVVRLTDTGDIWICPICNKKYRLLHVEPIGTHRFEEVIE